MMYFPLKTFFFLLDNQRGCFLASLKLVLEIGVPYSPRNSGRCERYLCDEDGYTSVTNCGVIKVPSGCEEIEGNKGLPYPECCSTIICSKEDGANNDF